MVILAGMLVVALGCSLAILIFLDFSPELDTFFNVLMHGAMSLGPLAICPTMIYSVESWRKFAFLSVIFNKLNIFKTHMFKKRDKLVIIAPIWIGDAGKNELLRRETDTYFNQLAATWT
uniref:Uncharacterized protein n=1 Tax=Caenorhabditis japonica TaxID=281687 RepID=A0A8R1DSI9_CAEJA